MAAFRRIVAFLGVLSAAALLGACSTETLFRSDFNSTQAGTPPSPVQPVGSVAVFGPAGSVVVVGPPAGGPDNWVRIGRPNNQQDIAGMIGTLSRLAPPGHFTFSASLYMPSGATNVATVEFDSAYPQNPGFFHLDFMPDNTVRLNDDEHTKFGVFPRDQVFAVFVGLDTNISPPVAHVSLIGAGASGTADYPLQGGLGTLASQFVATRLWMGYPWSGTFQASGITVTRNNN